MIRRILILLSFIGLLSINSKAQNSQRDSLTITGRVVDNKHQPMDGCIVTIIQEKDSSILASSVTNEDGRYAISYPRTNDNLLLSLTGFNIKRQVKRITPISQTVNFNAVYESITLKEVEIKARKLWGSRDTLNYLVSAYMKGQDRTIGDILKQLPGITLEGGTVKYQGVPINHFYIENMDMFAGKYSIATNGIKAEDVSTVQVMENHEHIKALQDQIPPESAAINLKLKKKAKGRWLKTVDLGIGFDSNGLLRDVNAALMYFAQRQQHVFYYETDNTGSSVNWLKSYYGEHNIRPSNLTSIIFPGSSPVGKSLRNNQHNLCFSNLNKLSETAEIKYNITYRHDIQRQSSYSQTTYLLPNASTRMISEDISARNTTNATTVQLHLEDNGSKTYLKNTLDLAGNWSDDNGLVVANKASFLQHAFNRNLGLNNHTEWIQRTTNGGGFYLKTTNFVQTNPQALAIEGDMQARQDVRLSNMGSYNTLTLIRNIRKHNWTLAPSAELNIEYVGLKSLLNDTAVTMATSGDMGYLQMKSNLGANLQYVKNTFRLSFNLPLSLNYTKVDNEPIANETTKGKRMTLLFSPSFTMLWKATDNWTLSAGGSYGMYPTNWRNLMTAYLMSNYRTLNRYKVNLSENKSATIHGKIHYKNIPHQFFAYLSGAVSRSWTDILYGTTIDQNAHTLLQAEYAPNHSNNYSITISTRKEIAWHDMSIGATAEYSTNTSKILRQSVITNYQFNSFFITANLAFNLIKYIRLTDNYKWTISQSKAGNYINTIRNFSNETSLDVTFLPDRLLLNTTLQYTHNSGFTDRKDYTFMTLSITFKPSKKVQLVLNFDNILNTDTFVYRSNSNLTEGYTLYQLRPRCVMLTTHFAL